MPHTQHFADPLGPMPIGGLIESDHVEIERLEHFPDLLSRRTLAELDVVGCHTKRHRIFIREAYTRRGVNQQEGFEQVASPNSLHGSPILRDLHSFLIINPRAGQNRPEHRDGKDTADGY